MNANLSEGFLSLWEQYFPNIDLPLAFFYTDQARESDVKETLHVERCLIGNLKRVQDGFPFSSRWYRTWKKVF